MKFTVALVAILSISSTWAIEVNKAEDPKDKREAAVGYGSPGLNSVSYQGQEGANAISIGAGYSVGGAKPSYSFAGHSGVPVQFSSEGLQPSGHATIKLPPITLQPSQGLASGDLSQLMSQLSQSINSGALNLQSSGGHESYALASAAPQGEHGGQELSLSQYTFGAPKLQQYSFVEQPQVASPPSYAAGTKGLGSYGSTGPVLFTPSHSQGNVALQSYAPSSGHSLSEALTAGYAIGGAPSSGHSFGSAPSSGYSFGSAPISGHSLDEGGISFGGSVHSLGGSGQSLGGLGHSLGGSGYSLGGHSLGGSVQSLGGSGHSLGGSGYSQGGSGHSQGGSGHSLGGSGHSLGAGYTLGGSGHSLGGLSLGSSGNSYGGSYKGLGASYTVPSKGSFKPSAFLGVSVQGDSSHGLSSQSHSAPSFGSFGGSSHGGLSLSSLSGHGQSFGGQGASLAGFGASLGGHGASLGGHGNSFGGSSTKYLASYAPSKSEGYGNLESVASFVSGGHPGSSYSSPSSHGHSTAAQSASSSSPQYYVPSSKYASSFGEGSSSYKAPVSSSHSSLSSYSSSPKQSFGRVHRYSAPKDIQGSYSENSYNTIKYSEELKPRAQ